MGCIPYGGAHAALGCQTPCHPVQFGYRPATSESPRHAELGTVVGKGRRGICARPSECASPNLSTSHSSRRLNCPQWTFEGLAGNALGGVLSDDAIHEFAAQVEPTDCIVPQGGVLAMRPLLIHASSKSQSDVLRRVLHIEYSASMTVGEGLELAVA